MVGRQPYALAAFTPGEIPGTHFQRFSRPQGTWFCRKEPRKKKSPVTPPGIDAGTARIVAQRLNHYATPGPLSTSSHRTNSNICLVYTDISHAVKFALYETNITARFTHTVKARITDDY